MENTVTLNKAVNVVAYYFKNTGARLKCFPKRMEVDGRRVEFTETGLRHPVQKGQQLVHVFDMTDGNADYRLEFDAKNLDWRLVSIADMGYGAPLMRET
ncbi:hypothetical protein A3A68_00185 [Candidatus Saccharibacteria bacterium RIFCSPLOWO2_01_FULL_48_13]|nr:MAG: hypothetical protein A3A68_00185 [Candidatus Saccharibacteria bacterium RIFCSPLOWO2_01_FULL_48_13]